MMASECGLAISHTRKEDIYRTRDIVGELKTRLESRDSIWEFIIQVFWTGPSPPNTFLHSRIQSIMVIFPRLC